jgi:hypothetical protein
MKTISNILRVISVVALISTLYMLYIDNSKLRNQVNVQTKQIDSLKTALYEIQFSK